MLMNLYLISVFLHILSAMLWIGGMLFLILVVTPFLKQSDRMSSAQFYRNAGQRFRKIAWMGFAVFFVTGVFNLGYRGVRLTDFVRPEWFGSPYGKLVITKIALFIAILIVSAVHDFWIGPAATRAVTEGGKSDPAAAEKLRKNAALFGRINFILGLAMVALGVMIVRGVPRF